jgi:hypothetical protein
MRRQQHLRGIPAESRERERERGFPECESIAAHCRSCDIEAKADAPRNFVQHEEMPRLLGEYRLAIRIEAVIADVGCDLAGEEWSEVGALAMRSSCRLRD